MKLCFTCEVSGSFFLHHLLCTDELSRYIPKLYSCKILLNTFKKIFRKFLMTSRFFCVKLHMFFVEWKLFQFERVREILNYEISWKILYEILGCLALCMANFVKGFISLCTIFFLPFFQMKIHIVRAQLHWNLWHHQMSFEISFMPPIGILSFLYFL